MTPSTSPEGHGAALQGMPMFGAGYSAVDEFHYVHHQPGGKPYAERHAMELALARAATAAGIRLTLLDTLYLAGGIHTPLSPEQARFGDTDARAWLDRLASLRAEIAQNFAPDMVSVGAALHSVRAVPDPDLEIVAKQLPADLPLNIHVSEQPAENQACLQAYGVTPTGLLARHGLLSRRALDVGGRPSTRRWRALEHGQRLGSGERGRFSPGTFCMPPRPGRHVPWRPLSRRRPCTSVLSAT